VDIVKAFQFPYWSNLHSFNPFLFPFGFPSFSSLSLQTNYSFSLKGKAPIITLTKPNQNKTPFHHFAALVFPLTTNSFIAFPSLHLSNNFILPSTNYLQNANLSFFFFFAIATDKAITATLFI